jgi:hypothetical protein
MRAGWTMIAIGLFLVVACRDDAAPPATLEESRPSGYALDVAEIGCACADLECLGKAQRKIQQIARAQHAGPREVEVLELASQQLAACEARLRSAVAPAPAPADAAAPAAP